jgi:hypothetical protein
LGSILADAGRALWGGAVAVQQWCTGGLLYVLGFSKKKD